MPVTVLLRAPGYGSDEELMDLLTINAVDEFESASKHHCQRPTQKQGEEALIEIYEKMRPGEPATLDSAQEKQMFFDPRRW